MKLSTPHVHFAGLGFAAMIFGAHLIAHADVGLSFDAAPGDLQVAPGGSTNIGILLTTTAGEEVLGATYFLQVAGPTPNAVQLHDLNNGGSLLNELQTPIGATLDDDLGGFSSTLSPLPANTDQNIAQLSLMVDASADEGNYTVNIMSTGAKGAVYASSDFATASFDSLGSIVLNVTNDASDPDGDDDNDGMTNGFEDLFGFNKNDSSDALLDADGDGVLNPKEEERGTHPRVANVVLTGAGVSSDGDTLWKFGPLNPNVAYTLQHRANPGEDWALAVGPITVDDQVIETTVEHQGMPLTPGSPRNYRVFAEIIAPAAE